MKDIAIQTSFILLKKQFIRRYKAGCTCLQLDQLIEETKKNLALSLETQTQARVAITGNLTKRCQAIEAKSIDQTSLIERSLSQSSSSITTIHSILEKLHQVQKSVETSLTNQRALKFGGNLPPPPSQKKTNYNGTNVLSRKDFGIVATPPYPVSEGTLMDLKNGSSLYVKGVRGETLTLPDGPSILYNGPAGLFIAINDITHSHRITIQDIAKITNNPFTDILIAEKRGTSLAFCQTNMLVDQVNATYTSHPENFTAKFSPSSKTIEGIDWALSIMRTRANLTMTRKQHQGYWLQLSLKQRVHIVMHKKNINLWKYDFKQLVTKRKQNSTFIQSIRDPSAKTILAILNGNKIFKGLGRSSKGEDKRYSQQTVQAAGLKLKELHDFAIHNKEMDALLSNDLLLLDKEQIIFTYSPWTYAISTSTPTGGEASLPRTKTTPILQWDRNQRSLFDIKSWSNYMCSNKKNLPKGRKPSVGIYAGCFQQRTQQALALLKSSLVTQPMMSSNGLLFRTSETVDLVRHLGHETKKFIWDHKSVESDCLFNRKGIPVRIPDILYVQPDKTRMNKFLSRYTKHDILQMQVSYHLQIPYWLKENSLRSRENTNQQKKEARRTTRHPSAPRPRDSHKSPSSPGKKRLDTRSLNRSYEDKPRQRYQAKEERKPGQPPSSLTDLPKKNSHSRIQEC